MDNKLLPAVRVPTVLADEGVEGGGVTETPILDLPPSEKFGFAWPDKPTGSASSPVLSVLPGNELEDASEVEHSESESLLSRESAMVVTDKDSNEHTPIHESPGSNATPIPTSPPRLSRAFSMPLPSQLGHLKNPHRSAEESPFPPPSPLVLSTPPNSSFHELSVELADSVQMVIQTLLQISPPHLLDPAKEQFSACSLSVPNPSISAMLTTMKNLNYMSANLSTFADDSRAPNYCPATIIPLQNQVQGDFDIGEMLQSVGDAASGLAAQAGVDLVLFHADVGMKHVSVKGDECGISYTLSHIIRQILDISKRGDTIEIGLFIKGESSKSKTQTDPLDPPDSNEQSRSASRASSIQLDFDGTLRCTFEIAHKFCTPDPGNVSSDNHGDSPINALFREKPRFETIFLRRLLRHISGSVKEDLQPRLFSLGRACEFTVILEPGSPELLTRPIKLSPEEEAIRQPYANANIQLAMEPSLEEITQFVDSLRGKKAILHANANGSFAHHLTSYLTAWGMDVSHTSMLGPGTNVALKDNPEISPSESDDIHRINPSVTLTDSPALLQSETNLVDESLREKSVDHSPSFIIIDDDVEALQRRLVQLRSETTFNLSLRQRPKLAAHHRPKSSPHILRAKGVKLVPNSTVQPSPSPVVVHFTSLSNYKLVKDLINSILTSSSASSLIPEIIVLPKPAGPRRLLTALRTAVIKPIVDPFFSPIATSPISPNSQGASPFSSFFQNPSPSNRSSRPPISPRTASDRSTRSTSNGIDLVQRLPPSPLRESDSMEYFSEAAVKLGTSPSSGLVIQSPDGQPAGIFFHPRGAGSKLQRSATGSSQSSQVVNPPNLVRDDGNLRPKRHVRKSESTPISEGAHADEAVSVAQIATSSPERSVTSLIRGADQALVGISTSPSSSATWKPKPPSSPPSEDKTGSNTSTSSTITNSPAVPVPTSTIDMSGLQPAQAPRAGTNELRKSASPPGSPTVGRIANSSTPSAQKRNFVRRTAAENVTSGTTPSPAMKKGKQSADGNIIPPVNVLIVEDNPINRTILSTFMEKKKIKYDVAQNGAEAVTKWKSGGFHLILMDIQMPIMDGIDATKEIRRLERLSSHGASFPTPPSDGQRTPSDAPSSETKSTGSIQTPFRSSVIIVALTASSLQADRVAALAAGCNDYLTKPVSLVWLNSKIIEWGSIKALQMWADLRPDVAKTITSGQMNQARSIASKLHVPEARNRTSSESSPNMKLARLTSTQEKAMRMLSTVPRGSSPGRDLDQPESEFSDSEIRSSSLGPLEAPDRPGFISSTSSIGTRTSSGSSSAELEAPLQIESKPSPLAVRPIATREISGEEALLTHIRDSGDDISTHNHRDQVTILGQRGILSAPLTIAEVMHGDTEGTSSLISSINETEDGEKEYLRPSVSPSTGDSCLLDEARTADNNPRQKE